MEELPDEPVAREQWMRGLPSKAVTSLANGAVQLPPMLSQALPDPPGLTQLVICVLGIYASFLSWAFLQERITTTPYGSTSNPQRWTFSIVLNTVQSFFATIIGFLYLLLTNRSSSLPPIFPSRSIVGPLLLVSLTTCLASPFGYASLAHIDYITFILAKSCKLLPVMFLHLTVFRKRYPLYKYAVVALVTAGVSIFTLHHPSSSSKNRGNMGSSTYGLFLLSINLLFDGLTNSTQDHIFSRFRPYSGPQMMVALNAISTCFTTVYLFATPYLPATVTSTFISKPNELSSALSFLRFHPAVLNDVLGFAACGAIGQIFIFHTLSRFSSLLLVTVTVTRKMLSMLVSVIMFGHSLSGMQWVGVGLVFGGVGGEAVVAKREKDQKKKKAKSS